MKDEPFFYMGSEPTPPPTSPRHDLRKDGKLIKRCNSYNECLDVLHDVYPGSWDNALKYEGYTITPMMEDRRGPAFHDFDRPNEQF
jgi:hypothetical protein